MRIAAAGELLGRGAAPRSGLEDNYAIPATRVVSPKLQGQKAHRKEAGQQQDLTSTHFKPKQSHTARPVLPAQDGCSMGVLCCSSLMRGQGYRDHSWQHHKCPQQG